MKKALIYTGFVLLMSTGPISCSKDSGEGDMVIADSTARPVAAIQAAELQVTTAADAYIDA